eukprot:4729750-Pyramimonas_sp.AAC.1
MDALTVIQLRFTGPPAPITRRGCTRHPRGTLLLFEICLTGTVNWKIASTYEPKRVLTHSPA